jgi:branched-chain amino acid transport system permease protein
MLGGYLTFWLFALWQIDPFVSLLGVAPAMFACGLVLYLALFQFVIIADEDLRIRNSLLIGFGLTLVLQASAIQLWTADERSVTTQYAGGVIRIGGFFIPLLRMSSLLFAFAILLVLHLFLARTRWGRAIRATAEDWEAAALMGIPVGRAYMLAFALGTALAGVAGGLVSISYSISPSIGLEWTLKALIVIVLSGLGSLFGSFAGGIVLGLAEALSVVFLGGPYREVVGLIIFLIVLLVRPQGLFGARA